MGKLKLKTDMAKFRVSANLAIDPYEVLDFIEDDDQKHTWVRLLSGRMYRTVFSVQELHDMLELAKVEVSDKVESDTICKTRAELANEVKGKRKRT